MDTKKDHRPRRLLDEVPRDTSCFFNLLWHFGVRIYSTVRKPTTLYQMTSLPENIPGTFDVLVLRNPLGQSEISVSASG